VGDDRPKKSWKEIDAGRDRSGGAARPRRDPDERSREKVEKSAAYSKYKSNLDKLFTPGGNVLPENMRAKLGPTDPAAQEKRALLDALKATPNEDTLSAALDKGVELPEDARLLMSLFDIKKQTLLVPVLRALLRVVESGKKPNRMLALQKLDALKNRSSEDDVLELCAMIRAQLE
jgi:hypothetical protein